MAVTLSSIFNAIDPTFRSNVDLNEQDTRASKTLLYRDYYDGDQDVQLTEEMKTVIRNLDFSASYCKRVVNSKADRLIITNLSTDNDTANNWLATVLQKNKFEKLYRELNKATLRDGNAYLMVTYDSKNKLPKLTLEQAYDGYSGIIPIYKSFDLPDLHCVIKIWHEVDFTLSYSDVLRVNVYFPDRVDRYKSDRSINIIYLDTIEWMNENQPIGIPIFHFRIDARQNWGLSVLDNIIPLQDAYNRVFYSFLAAGELSGFQIFAAIGFEPPDSIAPGGWIQVGTSGLTGQDTVDIKPIPAGDLSQLINSLAYIKNELHDISNTPQLKDTIASGESKKEAQANLTSELVGYQIELGDLYEQVVDFIFYLESIFGTKLFNYDTVTCVWKSAESRSNTLEIDNILKIQPFIDQETTLTLIGRVYDWSQDQIQEILGKVESEKNRLENMNDMSFNIADNSSGKTDNNLNNVNGDNENDKGTVKNG